MSWFPFPTLPRYLTYWWRKHTSLRYIVYFLLILCVISLIPIGFVWAGFAPKRVGAYIFVILWFCHLAVGAGAGYAAYRLWPERDNPFIAMTMIALHAPMLNALAAIALLFVVRGVKFTWKFSIMLFGFMFLWDVVTTPLVFFILRGPRRGTSETRRDASSGELPANYWMAQFDDLRNRIDNLAKRLTNGN